MEYRQPRPSDVIRELFMDLGWNTRLHPRATEDDWRVWLENFAPPVKRGNCPECGAKLEERNGRYGPFIGCTAYPGCRHTADLATAEPPPVAGPSDDELADHAQRLEGLKARAWAHFEGRR